MGGPSSMRSVEASERAANSWKMVNMQLTQMLWQSMNTTVYATGLHTLLIDPIVPAFQMKQSSKEMFCSARMSVIADST